MGSPNLFGTVPPQNVSYQKLEYVKRASTTRVDIDIV